MRGDFNLFHRQVFHMLIIQAIILGLVQGLTEFIPISSSAHLIIVPWLFGWDDTVLTSLTFDVALHLGTLVAVLWYFWADWLRLIRAGVASIVERRIGDDTDRKLAWLLVIGTIPGALAGALFESRIEALFHQPNAPIEPTAMIVMGVIVALLAGLLLLAELLARHERDMDQLTWRDGLLIGLAQAFAIFPGVSRSGGTITAGLGLGLKRDTAARFSFMLSAPIIGGVVLKAAWDVVQAVSSGALASSEFILFPIGVVVSGVSGYLAIRFLLRYLRTNSNKVFVWYRFGLAALLIIVAVARG
jgi:undecaprenyl-diphosphatase